MMMLEIKIMIIRILMQVCVLATLTPDSPSSPSQTLNNRQDQRSHPSVFDLWPTLNGRPPLPRLSHLGLSFNSIKGDYWLEFADVFMIFYDSI